MTRYLQTGLGIVYPEDKVNPEHPLDRFTPVVVIDPADDDQVQRLAEALTLHGGWRDIQEALRSLIAPPKPDEPTGLGAVVEDDRGLRWVRVNEHLQAEWRPADAASTKSFRKYAGIDAVKVLSEGVR